MEASISVVIPVRNAQSRLAREIPDLLEVLGEMTSQFEIILVDDASDDRTEEAVYELSRRYPQVRCAVHRRPQGLAAAGRTGLGLATGDIAFVHEENQPLNHIELLRLWEYRHDPELAIARLEPDPSPLSPEMLRRLSVWGATLKRHAERQTGFGGVQMIRVQAAKRLVQPGARGAIHRVDAADRPGRPQHAVDRRIESRLSETGGGLRQFKNI